MREGWEYRGYNWVEVLTIINGKNQSAVQDDNGEYPIYGSGGVMGYANDFLCPENTVVIGRKGNINKPLYVTTKFWNVDTAFGLDANRTLLLPKYLYYFCLDYDFERHNKAVTIPSLTKADLLKINMALPSLNHQLEIVSELDQINELIRLKKEQLKDYDDLAQSIFYEMFGDPVENEKGWEVKKLSEIFNVTSSKRIYLQELVSEGIPFLKVSDIVSMVEGKIVAPKSFIEESLFYDLQNRGLVPRKGDLLITARGTLGKCYIMKETDRFYFQDGMVTWLQKTVDLESLFVKFVFCDNSFRVYLNRNAKHTTVDYISIQHLGKMSIPLPPLPLQQEFSSRISQIERQKAEVSNAIADLETLLASRMQYWFE